jgi:hypothetical protein
MSHDAGAPHYFPHFVDLSRLPKIVSLEIRRRRFDVPRRVTRLGVDQHYNEALEFKVDISEPFPIRALGPTLWVGEEALTSADVDGLTYRFFAFEPEKLTPNAPISLGWNSPSEARAATRFRFTMP